MTFLEAGESKIKVRKDSVSGENSLVHGLVSSHCPPMVAGARELRGVPFYKVTNPIDKGFQIPSHWALGMNK